MDPIQGRATRQSPLNDSALLCSSTKQPATLLVVFPGSGVPFVRQYCEVDKLTFNMRKRSLEVKVSTGVSDEKQSSGN